MGTPAPTTTLQGCFRVPFACTIRVILDPGGAATTHDFAVSAGTYYAGADALVAAWQAALGAGWTIAIDKESVGEGVVAFGTPGDADYSVEWSHSGDGTAIRDLLGEPGDIIGRGSWGAWTAPVACWFRPLIPAQRASRRETRKSRSHLDLLSGSVQTQHSLAHGEADTVALDLSLWFASLDEFWAFETYFLLGLPDHSDNSTFLVTHGLESWTAILDGDALALTLTPVDAKGTVYQMDLPLMGVGATT